MTEQQFLILKEKLTLAARVRGRIAAQKKKIQSWTRTEDRLKSPDKKDWANKKILAAIDRLAEIKKEFEDLKIEL